MSPAAKQNLLDHRNKTVAKTFYRQLKTEGYSHQQIIDLSAQLIDLVTQEMRVPQPTA